MYIVNSRMKLVNSRMKLCSNKCDCLLINSSLFQKKKNINQGNYLCVKQENCPITLHSKYSL